MILFNFLLHFVAVASALSSQSITEQNCAIIPEALPAQIEICYTKLAKQTGMMQYCDQIPTNEGIGRCKGYLLTLQRPSWTIFVHKMLWYYLAAIAAITLIVTTERKEFIFGLSIVALLSALLTFLSTTTDSAFVQSLLTALREPMTIVFSSVPTWLDALPSIVIFPLVFAVTYGQILGHCIGNTKPHYIVAIVFAILLLLLNSYSGTLYSLADGYFS